MQISYVMPNSPDKTVYPVVINLGVSNHDHAVNQVAFHDDGRLLWGQGSNTNAGVKNIMIGGLDVRFHHCVNFSGCIPYQSMYICTYIRKTIYIYRFMPVPEGHNLPVGGQNCSLAPKIMKFGELIKHHAYFPMDF